MEVFLFFIFFFLLFSALSCPHARCPHVLRSTKSPCHNLHPRRVRFCLSNVDKNKTTKRKKLTKGRGNRGWSRQRQVHLNGRHSRRGSRETRSGRGCRCRQQRWHRAQRPGGESDNNRAGSTIPRATERIKEKQAEREGGHSDDDDPDPGRREH